MVTWTMWVTQMCSGELYGHLDDEGDTDVTWWDLGYMDDGSGTDV